MKRFKKANVEDDINEIQRERVKSETTQIQNQINESPEEMPANMAFEPNSQMSQCIKAIQYTLLPALTSGAIAMTGEMSALYTSLIRCVTEFEHSMHAIRAIQILKYHSKDYGVKDPQMFGILVGQQMLTQDEHRMKSFKEMTYVLREMSQLRSIKQQQFDGFLVRLVDQCEAAMGQDVSKYELTD
jgi:hypothetical protein